MVEYPDTGGTVVLVTRYGMGQADRELQLRLIEIYLKLLDESDAPPAAVCFYGEGVKLVVEGSPVLDLLRSLEAKGVQLIVCTTCLNYFDLADRLAAGVAGGMADIVEAQFRAKKVITV